MFLNKRLFLKGDINPFKQYKKLLGVYSVGTVKSNM